MNRLLIVSNEFPPGPGGIGNQAFNLASEFSRNGFDVTVFSGSRFATKENQFDQNQNFAISRYPTKGHFSVFMLRAMVVLLKLALQSDIILLSGSKQLLLAFPFHTLMRKRIICIVHGHELHMAGKFFRYLLKHSLSVSDRVVAVSEFSKGRLCSMGYNGAVGVIPNGVLIDASDNLIHRRRDADGRLRLVTVGSVTRRKGQHNVVAAMPLLLQYFPKLEYHVIGMPLEELALKIQVAALQLTDRVFIHGALDDAARDLLLRQMDIFMMLSENLPNGDTEGFGIAILEANSLGIPAIGSIGTGVEQAINSGRSGILVHADKPEEIADALSTIERNFQAYSESARSWAKEHDWKLIGMRYVELISGIRD